MKDPQKKRAYDRARYKANSKKIIASVGAYQKANPEKVRKVKLKILLKFRAAWLEIIKLRGMDKCALCGYNRNFMVIEFHHKNPKEKEANVSRLMEQRPTPKRLVGLDKCMALCANCHRELHHPQREDIE